MTTNHSSTFINVSRTVAACLILAVLLCLAPPVKAQDEQAHDLAAFAAQWVEREREMAEIPAVITALVVDGEVVMAQGFGFADIRADRAADENTRFRVGSLSKPVTATIALMAMEEYGVDPDTDLRALFGDLPIRPALEEPLTFRHLLTHAGGFSESLSGQHMRAASDFLDLHDYLQTRLPPRFERPGQIITYNDHHTALAGYAVEQLSATAFSDYVETRLFAPLGMDHSTFDQIEIVESQSTPLARSYSRSNGHFVAYRPDYIMTAPAAGLATTAADMGQYLAHLLDGTHTEQLSVQFENDPRLRGRAYGFVETSRGGHLVLYKDGQANGFGARLVLVPDLGFGVFVAVNRSVLAPMGAPNEVSRFLRNYTAAVLEAAIPVEASEDAPPDGIAGANSEQLAGTYRTTVAARHTWEKLLSMTDTATVTARADGAIGVGSGIYVP